MLKDATGKVRAELAMAGTGPALKLRDASGSALVTISLNDAAPGGPYVLMSDPQHHAGKDLSALKTWLAIAAHRRSAGHPSSHRSRHGRPELPDFRSGRIVSEHRRRADGKKWTAEEGECGLHRAIQQGSQSAVVAAVIGEQKPAKPRRQRGNADNWNIRGHFPGCLSERPPNAFAPERLGRAFEDKPHLTRRVL